MTTSSIEQLLESWDKRSLLRFSTAGSVDDGKSTLIGRLLHDSRNVHDDIVAGLKNKNKLIDTSEGEGQFDLAFITDGLRAEREQKITIDVAYRYFATQKRKFILADTPGHEQYTRNMATGASTANAALILIDASKGVLTQTKRHAFISSLLGIRHLLVAVNKMDMVEYYEDRFLSIKSDFESFLARLDVLDVRFIPVSALKGDNVVYRSSNTSWYEGPTVLQYLEDLYIESDRNLIDFRMPVQLVLRPDQNFRGFAGTIASGVCRVRDEVLALPSRQRSRIKSILGPDGEVSQAFAPESVTLTLESEIDISRGDMLVFPQNQPKVTDHFEMMTVWMSEEELNTNKEYIFKHNTHTVRGRISCLRYQVDVNTLHRAITPSLKINEIGRCAVMTKAPLYLDSYKKNRQTGNLVIIDPVSNATVGVGMVIDRIVPEDKEQMESSYKKRVITSPGKKFREHLGGQKAVTLWLTGLSGSGKSTISKNLEQKLCAQNILVYRLDGDELRSGLCKDLGFSMEDRKENNRRAAELAKTLNNAGIIVIVSMISPLESYRTQAREIIGEDRFFEVFVDTPLEVCEFRDPKGLYAKARQGEIQEFTGITSTFENPKAPHLTIKTEELDVNEATDLLLSRLQSEWAMLK